MEGGPSPEQHSLKHPFIPTSVHGSHCPSPTKTGMLGRPPILQGPGTKCYSSSEKARAPSLTPESPSSPQGYVCAEGLGKKALGTAALGKGWVTPFCPQGLILPLQQPRCSPDTAQID